MMKIDLLGMSLVDRFLFHEKAHLGVGIVFILVAVAMVRFAERHRVAALEARGPHSS